MEVEVEAGGGFLRVPPPGGGFLLVRGRRVAFWMGKVGGSLDYIDALTVSPDNGDALDRKSVV